VLLHSPATKPRHRTTGVPKTATVHWSTWRKEEKIKENNHLTHHIRSLPPSWGGKTERKKRSRKREYRRQGRYQGYHGNFSGSGSHPAFDNPLRPIPLALQPSATISNVASLVDLSNNRHHFLPAEPRRRLESTQTQLGFS
jgi:hypothetical protein